MLLALRITVSTYRGALLCVPRLVDVLRRNRAGASFLFALGPDHAGQELRLTGKVLNGRSKGVTPRDFYGYRSLLNGTLLPGPNIGHDCADILRATRDAGFEVAIQCWNQISWRERVTQATATWTEIEMRRAHERFVDIFGCESTGHAAAGWQMNVHALRLTQRLGYRWASDCRGTHPFMPVWNGEVVHCPQLPTTLPTIDELLLIDGVIAETIHAPLLRLTAEQPEKTHVFAAQAELEGSGFLAAFEAALTGWREQGFNIVALGDLAATLDTATLPRNEVVQRPLPGRHGMLLQQGEDYLSSWRDAA